MTVSQNIKFSTVNMRPDRRSESIIERIIDTMDLYQIRDFKIQNLLMDREIVPMIGQLNRLGINVNTTAANEHVPEV